MIEKNKITRAKYLIYKYVENLLIEIRVLNSQNLSEELNLPSHNLSKEELIILLWQMFASGDLVAQTESRGYFSPSLLEIENALNEPSEFSLRHKNTYYGFISAAYENYQKLKENWENNL